ncbi:MAG: NADH-quinone oxidoreductase subunit I [Desulfobacteraceae bacterium]|nr:NADH-quinone oxidoreductase subunit I [Desulfobacteraceae bacterium]
MGYFREIYEGGASLVEGMKVTFRRLFHPLVTVQYPRKALTLSPAFRGHTELKIFEDTGTHHCIACLTCERMCPSGVIKVEGVKTAPKGPKVASRYEIDFSKCSLCGICVECCPTDTLQFSTEYELVGDNRGEFVIDLLARLRAKGGITAEPVAPDASVKKGDSKKGERAAA